MGRAIVRDPSAFLMDEPLSNLDAKLRVQMRTEVSRIQQRLGTTTVYVTHDQTEAMTLGDRVAVMRSGDAAAGRLADGALQPPAQPVRGRLHRLAGDELHARDGRGRHGQAADRRRAPARRRSRARRRIAGQALLAGIRPENFEDASLVGEARDRGDRLHGAQIEVLESLGSELYAHFTVVSDQQIESQELRELAEDAGGGEVPMAGEEGRIVARLDPASKVRVGEDAELWVDASQACTCSTPRTGAT